MTSTAKKLYHIDGIDSRNHLDICFSGKEDMVFGDDILRFPMMCLHYQFSTGQIKGIFLIDISYSSIIHHLFSASNYFKHIFVLKTNEKCMMELRRWQHNLSGAYDWIHTSATAAELEGMRDQLKKKEIQLKLCINQILKCDFNQENIPSPVVLPLADCIVSAWMLDVICQSEDDYLRNMEKILKLLKPGGKMLLFGSLGASYCVVGGERFHCFKYNEDFVKEALDKLGMVTDYCAVQWRCNVSDLADYKAIMFISAHKRGEVTCSCQ